MTIEIACMLIKYATFVHYSSEMVQKNWQRRVKISFSSDYNRSKREKCHKKLFYFFTSEGTQRQSNFPCGEILTLDDWG